jgi:hypothetical protein
VAITVHGKTKQVQNIDSYFKKTEGEFVLLRQNIRKELL